MGIEGKVKNDKVGKDPRDRRNKVDFINSIHQGIMEVEMCQIIGTYHANYVNESNFESGSFSSDPVNDGIPGL